MRQEAVVIMHMYLREVRIELFMQDGESLLFSALSIV
jgi:hypothetical protein